MKAVYNEFGMDQPDFVYTVLMTAGEVRMKNMVPDEVEQLVATVSFLEEREAKLIACLKDLMDILDEFPAAYDEVEDLLKEMA
tara:strand:- start:8464 stop:8712 length:249 start_codon:yes stop_codon:yes gene_type:complete